MKLNYFRLNYLQYLTRVFSIDFISESGVILSRSSKGLGLSRYCSNSSKGILVLIVLLISLLNREFLLHSLVLMVLLFWVVWEETALKLSTWEARQFIKGYCQLFGCGLLCYLSLLDGPRQQFQSHFFFISSQKHKRGYQKSLHIEKNLNLLSGFLSIP